MSMEQSAPLQLIIITGLSGAGKSTATHFFEDSGYFCMDNVPPTLLSKFIQICLESNGRLTRVAVVIDARGGSFFRKFFEAIEEVKKLGVELRMLFLDATDDILIKRFSETRRRHPLNRGGRISDDIREERALLEQTRERADYIIDTSSMNGRELQEEIRRFTQGFVGPRAMSVVVVSFGFKHGVPLDCDLVFDVRFLPNPFYIAQLKTLTGINREVYDYVFASDSAKAYAQKLKEFIEFQIPLFISEPKTRLQIGIGCTGGRHRSVAFAEFLFKELTHERITISRTHRDINL